MRSSYSARVACTEIVPQALPGFLWQPRWCEQQHTCMLTRPASSTSLLLHNKWDWSRSITFYLRGMAGWWNHSTQGLEMHGVVCLGASLFLADETAFQLTKCFLGYCLLLLVWTPSTGGHPDSAVLSQSSSSLPRLGLLLLVPHQPWLVWPNMATSRAGAGPWTWAQALGKERQLTAST